jgi:uncharacterized membrane protein
MDQVAAAPAPIEAGRFSAVLTPHRSLSPHGFLLLMVAIGILSFATGLGFLLLGAWPVMGFFGLDLALVYIAFQLNYRAARLYETVDLTAEALKVTRVHPSGKQEQWDFNPYWARLVVEEDEDERVELKLRSHGRELVFGGFLSDDEKRDFAKALKGAMSQARGA